MTNSFYLKQHNPKKIHRERGICRRSSFSVGDRGESKIPFKKKERENSSPALSTV